MIRSKKRGKSRICAIILLLIVCSTSLVGCERNSFIGKGKTSEYEITDAEKVESENTLGGHKSEEEEQAAFDTWCQEQFIDSMNNTSTLNLHYMINDPNAYNITEGEISFGDIEPETVDEDIEKNRQGALELSTFNYELLSEEQKVTYDVLYYFFELVQEGAEFVYYSDALSPGLGIPANLPVELAEYPLNSKENVETYLTLLTTLPDYFSQLAEFEKEVAEQGLFISDEVLQETVEQMEEFIAAPEDNYLITTFAERLDTIEGLTDSEKQTYIATNEANVKNYIITAYEQLIKDLMALEGSGKNNGGLSHFEKGKEYYSYLAKHYTCSNMTVEEIWDILTDRMDDLMERLSYLVSNNYDLYDAYDTVDYEMDDPNEMLSYLKEVMREYYPECPAVNYEVKYVDESLAEFLSPAFYMVPQMDNYQNNVIYINNKSSHYSSDDLFATLAHEGFPGHLYQTTYYDSTNPNPIRQILNFSGYSEGWATYVELSSYELIDFGDLDKEITDLAQIEAELSLALSSISDIGVNYKGWDKEELKNFLDNYGMGSADTVDRMNSLVIEDPGNYLKYYVSYLEFWDLRCKAKTALGEAFQSKDFHEVVLKCGPSPFPVIEKQVDKYIEANK